MTHKIKLIPFIYSAFLTQCIRTYTNTYIYQSIWREKLKQVETREREKEYIWQQLQSRSWNGKDGNSGLENEWPIALEMNQRLSTSESGHSMDKLLKIPYSFSTATNLTIQTIPLSNKLTKPSNPKQKHKIIWRFKTSVLKGFFLGLVPERVIIKTHWDLCVSFSSVRLTLPNVQLCALKTSNT